MGSMAGMMEAMKKNTFSLLFLGLTLVAYFAPVLFMGDTFFFRDVTMFGIPEKWFQLEMYKQGALPFWNPHIFSGVPFMPLLHPNPTYPGNILLFVGEFPYGHNLFLVAHHALLVVSVFALIRHWGMGCGAATAASLVALLGGYFLSIVSLGNQFISGVWMPLILLSTQKYLKEAGKGWLLLALVSLVMQVLGGSPESCMMSTLIVLLALIFLPTGYPVKWKEPLVVVSGLVATALGLTAFQLIPTYLAVKRSVRSWDLGTEFNTGWSLEPDNLWTFFFHRNFDSFMEGAIMEAVPYLPSIYMGILPACVVLLAPVFIRKREVMFWTVMFWFGIFLALGKYNILYTAMLEFNPFLKMFRYPEKFIFLSAFSMVFLTAYWWESFVRNPQRAAIMPCGLAFLMIAFLMLGGSMFVSSSLNVGGAFVLLALFAGISLFALTGKIKRPQVVSGMVMFLLFVDLWMAHSRMIPFMDEQIFNRQPEIQQSLPEKVVPYRVYSGDYTAEYRSNNTFLPAPNLLISHILQKEYAKPNLGTIFDLEYADGLMAIEYEYVWLWTSMFKKSPPEKRQRMLARSNVTHQILPEDVQPVRVRPMESPLPRAFMVPRFRLGPEVKLLNTYFSESFDPLKEVLLDKPVEFEASPHFAGTVEGIHYGPNRVEVLTRQEGNGFLVLLDSWFPGWMVRVDGQDAPLLRANHFFRAVKLGPGNHRLEFEYVPEGFVLGKNISMGFLFLVMSLIAAALFRNPAAFKR